MNIKRTERGWAGHFICADMCSFRRNTLIEGNNQRVVVSTVGLMRDFLKPNENAFKEVGLDRYFETMVFMVKDNDTRYNDADVSKQVCLDDIQWSINIIDADDKANEMHELNVNEVIRKMENGEILIHY